MILKLKIGIDVYRVELAFVGKRWSVSYDQVGWGAKVGSWQGKLETKEGALVLSNTLGKVIVAIQNPPDAETDRAHKEGSAEIRTAKDPRLIGQTVRWECEILPEHADVTKLSPLRKRALETCQRNLPAPGSLQEPPNIIAAAGMKKTAGGATGCGGFPGWLVQQLGGAEFVRDRALVRWKLKGETKEHVTMAGVVDPTIAWEQIALVVEKRRNAPGTVWTAFKSGSTLRPLPGDIYLLKKQNGEFRHVGVIANASDPIWMTADGGQGEGFAVGFQYRRFDGNGGFLGLLRGGGDSAYLKGWVNLEALLRQPGEG